MRDGFTVYHWLLVLALIIIVGYMARRFGNQGSDNIQPEGPLRSNYRRPPRRLLIFGAIAVVLVWGIYGVLTHFVLGA